MLRRKELNLRRGFLAPSLKQCASGLEDGNQVDDVQKIFDEINKDSEIQKIIRQHQKYPEISLAEPNYPVQYCKNPNDPRYSSQQRGLRSEPAGIVANGAWDYQTTTARALGILDHALRNHEPCLLGGGTLSNLWWFWT
jgi:hypothetical protein